MSPHDKSVHEEMTEVDESRTRKSQQSGRNCPLASVHVPAPSGSKRVKAH